MPTLLQFGAGNIGRGFIAPTFANAGWQVIFVEVAPALLAALREPGARYQLHLIDDQQQHVQEFTGFHAINGLDTEAVAHAVATCDLAATAVGLTALPHLGRPIAEGLQRRERPLDILVCENGMNAHTILHRAVDASRGDNGNDPSLRQPFGCVRTSIGRMIPPTPAERRTLDLRVEYYDLLPVDRHAFRGPIPLVPNLKAVDNFELVITQKLYLHNLLHAALAYGGHLRGYTTIADTMADGALVERCTQAAYAVATAIGRRYGSDAEADSLAMIHDVLHRFRNRHLADPIRRVARDPWRKLAKNDRLVGGAQLCLEHGVAIRPIADAIADACHYQPMSDEPNAAEWASLPPLARLSAAAGLLPDSPIMRATAHSIAHTQRRHHAAHQMRSAGLHLRDDEIPHLEITDFGLGCFAEIGLAIHVYMNTHRCCAKEIIMLPGQMCPEHRHPHMMGETMHLGKEETFRVRFGEIFLHIPGHVDAHQREYALSLAPKDKRDSVSVFHTIHLSVGDQYTLPPDTLHWFTAGPNGAVVSEFSTTSRDERDIFTDPAIVRVAT